MTASLTLACLWAVIALLRARAPQRFHGVAAAALLAAGIPLLGWITWLHGPLWGMLGLAAGAVLLRPGPALRGLRQGGARQHNRQEPAE